MEYDVWDSSYLRSMDTDTYTTRQGHVDTLFLYKIRQGHVVLYIANYILISSGKKKKTLW